MKLAEILGSVTMNIVYKDYYTYNLRNLSGGGGDRTLEIYIILNFAYAIKVERFPITAQVVLLSKWNVYLYLP